MIFECTSHGDPRIAFDERAHRGAAMTDAPDHHVDSRGEIRRIEMNGVRCNLLFTRSGHMRSGDFHSNNQFDIVLSGRAELITIEGSHEVARSIGSNSGVIIKPYIPHLFIFNEDTVMLEWWDGPFSCWYWKPLREIIDKSLGKAQ